MKIVRLTAENIKRLVAVEIEPGGNVVKISGKNNAGKSSVLDSIWWALAGKRVVQGKPVRDGQKAASIRLELGDLIVTRRFNAHEDGDYTTGLTVENADGAQYPKAQDMLDGLIGRLAFDPLDFMRMDKAEQLATLKALAGIDTATLDAEAERVYEERRALNREIKTIKPMVESLAAGIDEDTPTEEQSATEVMADISAAHDHNNALKQAQAACDQGYARVADIEEELRVAKVAEEEAFHALTKLGEPADVATLEEQVRTLQERNAGARKRQELAAKELNLKGLLTRGKSCNTRLKNIEVRKADLVRKSKLPLPGLALGDDCVLYGDVPLDQAGSAEQLRVSMAMAMALHPKVRVIRITDGSLLDKESMAVIEEMADGEDFQVWVEVVDESGKVGVVIEDGHVAKVNK